MALVEGIRYESKTIVTADNCAQAVGSGGLEVFATPMMTALMENAAYNAVQPEMAEGDTTVGTKLDVAHLRASKIGEQITAEAILTQVDGRRLLFSVKASDSKGVIGEGLHERFVVNISRFISKL